MDNLPVFFLNPSLRIYGVESGKSNKHTYIVPLCMIKTLLYKHPLFLFAFPTVFLKKKYFLIRTVKKTGSIQFRISLYKFLEKICFYSYFLFYKSSLFQWHIYISFDKIWTQFKKCTVLSERLPSPYLLETIVLLADSGFLTSDDLQTSEDKWGFISDSLSA